MRIITFYFLFFAFIFADTNLTKEINNLKNALLQNEFFAEYDAYLNYQRIQSKLFKYEKDKNRYKNEIIKLKPLPSPVKVENPFQIITALNYEKALRDVVKENENIYKRFKSTLLLIKTLYEKTHKKEYKEMLDDFLVVDSIYKTQLSAQKSKYLAYLKEEKYAIQNQINKFIILLISIAISFLIFTFLKIIFRKYLKGEAVYFVNKILNILNITIIVLIITFFYINNATYVITILGFASAGIAIAMKDWFMNIFGWFVIMTSGNFKVGDRIKIYLQNGQVRIVGDVIDLTMTRIVVLEDVTFESYRTNKRAGRVVFVPNNVIFNNPIFNYTHSGLSTVWDTIEIVITFDSNYKKALFLAKDIVNKYAKGYTDITKRRMQKLKVNYNIKNVNLEPRIYTFIEQYGIVISCWFLNNYATLNLKSTISAEILDAFMKEDDIKIAYPTYEIKSDNERFDKTIPAL